MNRLLNLKMDGRKTVDEIKSMKTKKVDDAHPAVRMILTLLLWLLSVCRII